MRCTAAAIRRRAPDWRIRSGLIKSKDGGKTMAETRVEGESDFHSLATSHGTNTVYVFNPHPNSRMKQSGIYYTRNDGLQWQRAAAGAERGAEQSRRASTDSGIVAAGTEQGLYLSRDAGENFEQVVGDVRVFAEAFDLDGEQLWFSTYAGKAGLARVALKPGTAPETLSIPALGEDAVAYIAQNPVQRNEFAIATFKRSVFVSEDQGEAGRRLPGTERRSRDGEANDVLKVIVIVLATIGGLVVLGVGIMALMHFGMVGGMGCC